MYLLELCLQDCIVKFDIVLFEFSKFVFRVYATLPYRPIGIITCGSSSDFKVKSSRLVVLSEESVPLNEYPFINFGLLQPRTKYENNVTFARKRR